MNNFNGIPDREVNPPENASLERYVNSNQYKIDLDDEVDTWILNNADDAEAIFIDYLVTYNLGMILLDVDNEIVKQAREQARSNIADKHCSEKVQQRFLTPFEEC